MGQLFDPMIAGNGSEQPAEQEIAATVTGRLLPTLRRTLAELEAMQATWLINEMPAKIEAAAQAEAVLAGHSAATWQAWGTVLTELQIWLATPIEALGATPAQVLIRRYPANTGG